MREKKNIEEIKLLIRNFIKDQYTDNQLFLLFKKLNHTDIYQLADELISNNLDMPAADLSQQEVQESYKNLCAKAGIYKKQRKTKLFYWSRYAAAIMLLLFLGLWVGNSFPPIGSTPTEELSIVIERGNKGFIELNGASKVWINSGSRVKYNNQDNSEVWINGEAFFEIAPQGNKKFKVHTGHFDIIVHGTAFNVSAYDTEDVIKVALIEGSIEVNQHDNELFKILPGQLIEYTKSTQRFRIHPYDMTNVSLWKNKELVIRDMHANKLYDKLEAWYGVTINVKDDMKNVSLYNMVITNESLADVLQLISKLSPLDYTIDGKEVTVTYK